LPVGSTIFFTHPVTVELALQLERDEAHVQVRREVGLPQREPDGREARRTTARLNQKDEATGADYSSAVFSLAWSTGDTLKAGVAFVGWLGPRLSEIFGLRWHDLDLKNGAVSFRRGFVQGRITPLKIKASRANSPIPNELLELLRQ